MEFKFGLMALILLALKALLVLLQKSPQTLEVQICTYYYLK